ncbi:TIGR03943 family putative permease subunit [Leucobacter chromiiresistens]|uniref:TIGR03943 family protein n=1 Tax=Leucobacter chromiiresistens TaxID=1079994 RepID=A0A1H1BQP5_9MICO|nr:TIGR03943 family protein [Leucobacter chromiiresistens]SDQ54261.1 TIGR03943 family protein [Leucobacter chromiiresistens]
MWRERFDRYWRGIILSGLGIAAILWLAATGRLGWYVHPRYFWFTVSLCAIAAIALCAAVPALRRAERSDAHDGSAPRPLRRALSLAGAVLLVGATAAALLVAPPTTLSVATAQQRQVNAGSGPAGDAPAAGADADRDAHDWAMLLRQGGGAEAEGRTARFIGFVLPSPGGEPDLFTAARFVVSCCAVDAQPLGVPVLAPGWAGEHPEGSWVEVEGVFVANPDVTSDQPVVLRPFAVTAIDEPEDPYVY